MAATTDGPSSPFYDKASRDAEGLMPITTVIMVVGLAGLFFARMQRDAEASKRDRRQDRVEAVVREIEDSDAQEAAALRKRSLG